MSETLAAKIQKNLYKHPDGLSIKELTGLVKSNENSVLNSIKRLPYAYIDRWVLVNGQWAGIWCPALKPENCPKPDTSRKNARHPT